MQAYGAALLIVLASAVLGQAICVAAQRDQRSWAAPAVGLAALIVLANAVIVLPGRGVTAAAVVGLALALSAAFLWRRHALPLQGSDLAVCALPLIGSSLPFVASGRVGLPGVSVLNDTANHLVWAEGLLSSRMAKLWPPPAGYPLGPHSVIATVGTAAGIPLDQAFTGLLVAVVAITAIVAQRVIADEALWRRVVVALTCSLGYLVAAYYGEGAFKETIMAAIVLAFVLHMEQVRARWDQGNAAARWRHILPAAVLAAGAVYAYSYLGLVWLAVSIIFWVLAETVTRPAAVFGLVSRRNLSSVAPWVMATVALVAIVMAPVAGQVISFFNRFGVTPTSVGTIPAPLANLIGPLSPYEALDVWMSFDFRRTPANAFHAGELAAFALAVLMFGFIWSVRRRRLLLPATVVGCGLVWWLAQHTGSPYVAAKALAISVPVVTALGLRALLTRCEGTLRTRVFMVTAAAAFCGLAGYSSYQGLRNAPVQAPEAVRELAMFSHTIRDSPVLFLGDDDYSPWQARPAGVTALSPSTVSLGDAKTRANKPWMNGQALDFDSVDPADLDRFLYVVTSSGAYASQAPASFRLVKRSLLYDLWKRTGPAIPHRVLDPPGTPGAILNCATPLGKTLKSARGQASILTTPVTVAGPGFLPGESRAVSIPLPASQWELSIQYTSSFDVHLSTDGIRWTMPAYLGRLGPFFDLGSVTGKGIRSPLLLTIASHRPSFLTGTGGNLFTEVPVIAATRLPDTRRMVPLRRACGQYVDWYRLF